MTSLWAPLSQTKVTLASGSFKQAEVQFGSDAPHISSSIASVVAVHR